MCLCVYDGLEKEYSEDLAGIIMRSFYAPSLFFPFFFYSLFLFLLFPSSITHSTSNTNFLNVQQSSTESFLFLILPLFFVFFECLKAFFFFPKRTLEWKQPSSYGPLTPLRNREVAETTLQKQLRIFFLVLAFIIFFPLSFFHFLLFVSSLSIFPRCFELPNHFVSSLAAAVHKPPGSKTYLRNDNGAFRCSNS